MKHRSLSTVTHPSNNVETNLTDENYTQPNAVHVHNTVPRLSRWLSINRLVESENIAEADLDAYFGNSAVQVGQTLRGLILVRRFIIF